MSNRVQWDPRYNVGNDVIDNQHRAILSQIDALADCLAAASTEGDERFLKIFGELKTLAREHFATEEALLAGNAYPRLDEHRNEQEEFGYLETEIITTENFDKDELQTFLALWWTGHIVAATKLYRAYLEPRQLT